MELKIRYIITLLLLITPAKINGFRVELSHVDSKSNFTKIELINRAATRTVQRLSRLTSMYLFSSQNISSTISKDNIFPEYIMNLAIGNPPLSYSAIMDTGSDLIWTQCSPCKRCVFQPTPIYDPSESSTVTSIPCNSKLYRQLCISTGYAPPSCLCSYYYLYGTGWTNGTLKKETFMFGTTNVVSIPNIIFGCSTSTSDDFNGTAGIVGFGRGAFSLHSQLNSNMFSYCLTSFFSDASSTSTLFIGPSVKFSEIAIKSTPFVKSPQKSPMSTYYYVLLQGISLGTTKLPIRPSAFALQPDGTGGFIIDSGTTFTQLTNDAYRVVRNAIDSIVEMPSLNASDTGLDLCYYLPTDTSPLPIMPNMTFHFESADMVLPVDNYMIGVDDNVWCLAMHGSDSSSISPSILGNYQQQNFHILYDIGKEVLSFYPVQCDNL